MRRPCAAAARGASGSRLPRLHTRPLPYIRPLPKIRCLSHIRRLPRYIYDIYQVYHVHTNTSTGGGHCSSASSFGIAPAPFPYTTFTTYTTFTAYTTLTTLQIRRLPRFIYDVAPPVRCSSARSFGIAPAEFTYTALTTYTMTSYTTLHIRRLPRDAAARGASGSPLPHFRCNHFTYTTFTTDIT